MSGRVRLLVYFEPKKKLVLDTAELLYASFSSYITLCVTKEKNPLTLVCLSCGLLPFPKKNR